MASGGRRPRTSGQFIPSDEVDGRALIYSAPARRSSSRGQDRRSRSSVTASYRSRRGSQWEPKEEDTTTSKYPKCCTVIFCVFLVWALFAGGFLLGFYFYHEKMCERPDVVVNSSTQAKANDKMATYWNDPLQRFAVHIDMVRHGVLKERISDRLLGLGRSQNSQVLTGTARDEKLMKEIQAVFNASFFDNVEVRRYDLLLPMADVDKPNQLQIIDKNDTVLYNVTFEREKPKESPLNAEDEGRNSRPDFDSNNNNGDKESNTESKEASSSEQDQIFPDVAYSPSVDSVRGDLVYLNYGQKEDIATAKKLKVPLESRVALVRIGKTSIPEKVETLKTAELKAVLLYLDPADSGAECSEKIPHETLVLDGDPFTRRIPAVGGVMTQSVEQFLANQIPVQTIPCLTAQTLLERLSGVKAPESWQTGLNRTLIVGRKSTKRGLWTVQLSVHNLYKIKPVYNVIGTIQGQADSDHYILIGASRNGHSPDGAGGTVGTSLLLELAHSMSQDLQAKWRPRRTIKLCSWGAAEYGNLGMIEFIEGSKAAMLGKIVAYINLNQPVLGDRLTVTESPSLQNLMNLVTHRVFNESSQPFENPHYLSNKDSADDFFGQQMFVPTVHIQYKDPKMDPWIEAHQTPDIQSSTDVQRATNILRLSARLALLLSDASVVQYDVERTVKEMNQLLLNLAREMNAEHGEPSTQLIDLIVEQTSKLSTAATLIQQYKWRYLDYNHSGQCRQMNGKLMHFESYAAKVVSEIQDYKRVKFSHHGAKFKQSEITAVFVGFLNEVIQLHNILTL